MLVYALPNGGAVALVWGVSHNALAIGGKQNGVTDKWIFLVGCMRRLPHVHHDGASRARISRTHVRRTVLLDTQVCAETMEEPPRMDLRL